MTLNKFLSQLKAIAESHGQIKSYTFGDPLEVADKEEINGVAVVCTVDNVAFNRAEIVTTISLFIMDVGAPDEFNETEILSDTLQIARDLHAALRNPAADYEASEDLTLTPFVEYTGDGMAGWRMVVNVSWFSELNRCEIP